MSLTQHLHSSLAITVLLPYIQFKRCLADDLVTAIPQHREKAVVYIDNTPIVEPRDTNPDRISPENFGEALFRSAQKTIGLDAPVWYVAVSVDPEGDTPAQVRAFSDAHDLGAGWHYLVGPRGQLQAVWASYGVGSFPDPSGLGVAHNDAIFVIDRKGRERELIHSDVRLADLVADLRALTSEK